MKLKELNTKAISLHHFFLKFVPKWFQYLEWLIIFDAILLAYFKLHHDLFLKFILIITGLLFSFYVMAELTILTQYFKKRAILFAFFALFSWLIHFGILYFSTITALRLALGTV